MQDMKTTVYPKPYEAELPFQSKHHHHNPKPKKEVKNMIELTLLANDKPVYVNPSLVSHVHDSLIAEKKGIVFLTNGLILQVKQDADSIAQGISQLLR